MKQRNHVIDLARAASVVVVVLFHGLLYQIRIEDGRPLVIPWAPSRGWWVASWFLMVMPIFFIAGGFAQAVTLDRMKEQGLAYGNYLAGRGRRLVGPLVLFVTVCAIVASAFAWSGWLDEASELSRQFMQLLWFIAVYLGIVAAAPVLLRAQDAIPWIVILALAAAGWAVDAWSFAVDAPDLRYLNMAFVWPLVHQLGMAYHRGWFRTGPLWQPIASLMLGAGGVVGLVAIGYPAAAVGFANIPNANVLPPSMAMVLLAFAQCGLLGLVERTGMFARVRPRVEYAIATVNALMVTAYLWHIPFILVTGGLLYVLAALVPATAGFALSQATVSFGALALVIAGVPLIGRVELKLIPRLGHVQQTSTAIWAFMILIAGTGLVWRNGTVLHPGQPLSTLGLVAVWLGSWLMARAADAGAVRSRWFSRGHRYSKA